MTLLFRWFLGAVALLLVAYLFPGIHVDGLWPSAIVAALALGFANAFIRPILSVLTLPLTCLTFGLFSLVLNAVLFWAVSELVDGFEVEGALTALAGSVVFSLLTAGINQFFE